MADASLINNKQRNASRVLLMQDLSVGRILEVSLCFFLSFCSTHGSFKQITKDVFFEDCYLQCIDCLNDTAI